MNFDEYQKKASEFRLPAATPEERVFGLFEEAGEVSGIFKRIIRGDYGIPPDPSVVGPKLHKELGDVLWYLSQIALDNDWTLESIAKENIDKLESRRIRQQLMGSGDNR